MAGGLILALTTSYAAWFIEHHEEQVVYPFDATHTLPAEAGEPRLAERWILMPDGESLLAWVARPDPGRPVILYLPGNAGTLADRTPRFSAFLDHGYGLLALSYRGSSGSTGRPDEAAITADALTVTAAIPALLGRETGGGVVIYGESLGTAVAIQIAARGAAADAVVLEAPFTSVPALVAVQYPQEDLSGAFTQVWDSLGTVGGLRQPLFVLHGTADRLVPVAQGTAVFEAAGSADKTFFSVEGGSHQSLWTVEATAALFSFIDRF